GEGIPRRCTPRAGGERRAPRAHAGARRLAAAAAENRPLRCVVGAVLLDLLPPAALPVSLREPAGGGIRSRRRAGGGAGWEARRGFRGRARSVAAARAGVPGRGARAAGNPAPATS